MSLIVNKLMNGFDRKKYVALRDNLDDSGLHTVCIEANCPNRYECFSNDTATFMILGDVCTRNCKYCDVKKGSPLAVDDNEPLRIAEFVEKLNLGYVVITCVTRDDLLDGGAEHFVNVVKEIKKKGSIRVELLISDLDGNWDALKNIVHEKPDVINHNIEVVKRLFNDLRPGANYDRSLELLKKVKEFDSGMKTKSGLMIGFGESKKEIIETLNDLRIVGCDFLSIGQYLAPSKDHASVVKHYSDEEFEELKNIALDLGFEHVESGRLVRSSYHANGYAK